MKRLWLVTLAAAGCHLAFPHQTPSPRDGSVEQGEAGCQTGALRCDEVTPQTCDPGGQWKSEPPCPFLCKDGTCLGECMPGTRDCKGNLPQECDSAGAWQSQPPCPILCAAGVCAGKCVPNTKQCSGKVPQICSALGDWADQAACPFVCKGGSCTGVCEPGVQRCVGKTPGVCDAAGQWQDALSPCAYVCKDGSCIGVCAPGKIRCNGLTLETCDESGAWKLSKLCPQGCESAQCCLKPPGSAAGKICIGCGVTRPVKFNCDGSRTVDDGAWQQFSNDAACITPALCGNSDGPYWVNAINGKPTCNELCASLGATCGDECVAFGKCPASTTAGYNQSETYGCDSQGTVGNTCSSSIKQPYPGFNASCCCRGFSLAEGGTGCVKNEGEISVPVCNGCGFTMKTLFHCNGTRYKSGAWQDQQNNAVCVTPALCGAAAYWVRNMNGQKTCDGFCASVSATCVNACQPNASCAKVPCTGSDAGYMQCETYGCYESAPPDNLCSSVVQHPNNAFNAHCCCLGE